MRLLSRAVAVLLFGGAVACFALPFVTVSEERVGAATGFQLAASRAEFSGEYRHDLFEGDVEALIENGRLPAILALAFAAAGGMLVWLPGRKGGWAALAACGLSLLSLFLLREALTNRFTPSTMDAGYWIVAALVAALACWNAWSLRAGWLERKEPDMSLDELWRERRAP